MTKPILSEVERGHAMNLLRIELSRLGSKAAVATRIGCKRSAVSMVLTGSYPARPDGVLAAALLVLDQHHCPYLGIVVEQAYCDETNSGPPPTWDPSALTQRRTCKACPHYPRKPQAGDRHD